MNKQFAKKLIGYASAYVMGKPVNLKLEGDAKSVHIVESAIKTSRQLFQALQAPEAHMSEVNTALCQKRAASQKFKQHFGFSWPL